MRMDIEDAREDLTEVESLIIAGDEENALAHLRVAMTRLNRVLDEL